MRILTKGDSEKIIDRTAKEYTNKKKHKEKRPYTNYLV